jgi:hypothetical protein
MSFTRLELVRAGATWKIARRTSRLLGSEEAATAMLGPALG